MRFPGSGSDRAASALRYSLLLEQISQALGSGAARVALVLVGVAGVGEVNRRLGYVAGDALIEAFVGRLGRVVRPQDRLFRLNGTTYALLVHEPLHEGHALLAADRVVQVAAEPFTIAGNRARLRVHAGVSMLPGLAESPEQLLRQCEAALQDARRRGTPHALHAAPVASAQTLAASRAWFDMEDALKAGQLELFFQPQVELATGSLAAAEVLVRWHHPQLGHIAPGSFMPADGDGHSMRVLLEFVLHAALRQAAAWQKLRPGFAVSVNLAAANLDEADITEVVAAALSIWNLAPSLLTLELTESSLMSNPAAGVRVLAQLRELGLRTSIDDFGTGYSSLAYLRDLPTDELKIDRSFVSCIEASPRDAAIVRSIVQLAQAVGLVVVAEGIESGAVARALREAGCDLGQGYYWARPMSAADFESQWLRTGSLQQAG